MHRLVLLLVALALPFAALAVDDTSIQSTPSAQASVVLPDPPTEPGELDEFGDLHDPELIISFPEGVQNHMFGIAWDGEFYWTINGGNNSGLLNRYDENGSFMGVTNVSIDGRGIVFNPIDENLYISSYLGHLYRIDDPMTGAITQVFTGIMQNGQASLGMSWDGTLLYDFSLGTLQVHDFFSGALLTTITGLQYGNGNWGGECAIIADTDYLYTWNTTLHTLYVYTLNGDYVTSYDFPANIDNGMSLSMANYMIWLNEDSSYDIGTWYGYELREWTDGPVQFNLIPQNVNIPAGGGNIVYDVSLVSTLPNTIPGLSFWTKVTLPNGQVFGPLLVVPFVHTPFMQVNVVGLTQAVPGLAPAGNYTFWGYVGMYPGVVALSDDFEFTKAGAAGDQSLLPFVPAQWPHGRLESRPAGTAAR